MNINNNNSHLISENLLFKFNQYFNDYREDDYIKKFSEGKTHLIEYITFDNLLVIIKDFGYLPSNSEINDVKSEIGNKIDRIYYFVIMGRIIRKMRQREFINEIKRSFHIIDYDKNGTIEKDELFTIMKRYMSSPPCKDEIDIFFSELDLDNDGHITFDEFVYYIQHG